MRPHLLPIAASLALLLAACGKSESPAPAGPAADTRPASRPPVLLVTIDTARADRFGCYGYTMGRTPTVDALAAEGLRVERAYAHVPLTLPSHATILSGVHPAGHGLHVNFQGALPADLPTLAERFAAAGYRTGAFVSAWVLDRGFGLDRGFEHYDDLSHLAAAADRQTERTANQVIDATLRWLEADDPRPFFAWVHFFDPHDPYEPPNFYTEGLASMYDGELAFVDAQLARLMTVIEARGELSELVVVLTSDHGESLGEHGEATHGVFLYDATMRVPLIVRAPGRVEAGAVLPGPVGLVDLAPTLLELIGLAAVPGHEGRSFLPRPDARPFAPAPVLLESEYPRRSFGWSRLMALVVGDEKVIRAPTPERYDLGADPGEQTNLAPRDPARLAQQLEVLERRRASLPTRRPAALEADRVGGEARLSALGYVGGSSGDLSDDDLSRRDPKDVTHVLSAVMRAKRFADQGQPERVVATLEAVAGDSPESDELFALLGKAQLDLSAFPAAESSLRKSLRERSDHGARLTHLGDAVRSQGRFDEAMELYARAVAAEPNLGQAHSRLGLGHAQAGRFDLALHHFRRYADVEPNSANAQTNLANALLSAGRHGEGIERLQRALAIDPRCEPAHRSLWRALLLVGRRDEAIRALREARTIAPADRSLACELAWLLSTSAGADAAAGEALALAEACARGESPVGAATLDILAAAAAAEGDFARAVAEAERALETARREGLEALAAAIAARLERYRAGEAYREGGPR